MQIAEQSVNSYTTTIAKAQQFDVIARGDKRKYSGSVANSKENSIKYDCCSEGKIQTETNTFFIAQRLKLKYRAVKKVSLSRHRNNEMHFVVDGVSKNLLQYLKVFRHLIEIVTCNIVIRPLKTKNYSANLN